MDFESRELIQQGVPDAPLGDVNGARVLNGRVVTTVYSFDHPDVGQRLLQLEFDLDGERVCVVLLRFVLDLI